MMMMMQRPPTAFEITVLSAEDLRVGDRPLKKNTLVAVRTDHANNCETTSLDFKGGSCPSWNETLRLSAPAFTTWVMVEVQCIERPEEKRNKLTVATARVPVSDFREPANYLHFLSYRLKGRDGQRNGIINLSIRVC